MRNLPRPDATLQVDSNLPGNAIYQHRKDLMASQNGPFKDLSRNFNTKGKDIFSPEDIQAARALSRKLMNDFQVASLDLGGDAAKIRELKKEGRQELDRMLLDERAHYQNLLDLKFEYQREYQYLLGQLLTGTTGYQLNVAWGHPFTAAGEFSEYGPPFTLHDVQIIDNIFEPVKNDSFALPGSGTLVHNIALDYEDDDSGWGMDEVFGIDLTPSYSTHVSCGIPFIMPRTGELGVAGLLRNHYNKVAFSVTDQFGLSWAELAVETSLFVDIVTAPDHVTHSSRPLYTTKLSSDGEESSDWFSDLDTSKTYSVNTTYLQHFEAGEQMWIMVGADVYIVSALDDMACHIESVLWWELEKLVVTIY